MTSSLWPFAIHGKNSEIIHFLEERKIEPENQSYKECLKESIKCHHNNIANYIYENYLTNNKDDKIEDEMYYLSIKYYNFELINSIDLNHFIDFCKYGYYDFVNKLLEKSELNINLLQKRNNSEKSALFNAVENENSDVIELLLNNKDIDINILNKDDYTVDGFDISRYGGGFRETYEKTAFYLAVEKESIEIIKLFLNNDKLDVNIINK